MMKVAAKDPRWKTAAYGDSVKEDLKKAIDAIEYLPNGVAAFVAAHGGNKALAEINAKKVRKAEELLGEVLASLPAAIEYMVVGVDDKTMKFKTREELIHGLEKFGIKYRGESSMSSQFKPELRGQPEFDKIIGPMYGGPGIARYETQEVYDRNAM
jgi:hypothetical protein